MARLVRKQVYITTEQEDLLKQVAAREKRSEADIIRGALEERLRPRRTAPRRLTDDPLWDIVGIGRSDTRDTSARVDHYLYGAPRK